MSEISQAELLGIDLDELWTEIPEHPRQVVRGIQHRRKAREYWQARKLEQLLEDCFKADTLENYGEEAVR